MDACRCLSTICPVEIRDNDDESCFHCPGPSEAQYTENEAANSGLEVGHVVIVIAISIANWVSNLTLLYFPPQPLPPNPQIATNVQGLAQPLHLLFSLLCFIHVHFRSHMDDVLLANN
jgi:hypothetical protein